MFFRQLLPGLQSGNLCEGHLQVSACELGERFGFFGHGARILSLPSTGRGQNRHPHASPDFYAPSPPEFRSCFHRKS